MMFGVILNAGQPLCGIELWELKAKKEKVVEAATTNLDTTGRLEIDLAK